MQFTSAIVITLLVPGLPARAATLQAFNGSHSFLLEKTAHSIEFHAQGVNGMLTIRKCNRQIIEEFWQEAVRAFEKLPRASVRGATAKAYASLDNEKRWIVPLPGSRERVTPQALENLRLRSGLKCKS